MSWWSFSQKMMRMLMKAHCPCLCSKPLSLPLPLGIDFHWCCSPRMMLKARHPGGELGSAGRGLLVVGHWWHLLLLLLLLPRWQGCPHCTLLGGVSCHRQRTCSKTCGFLGLCRRCLGWLEFLNQACPMNTGLLYSMAFICFFQLEFFMPGSDLHCLCLSC